MSVTPPSSPVPLSAGAAGPPRLAGAGAGYHIITRPEWFVATAAVFLERKLRALGDAEIAIALSGGSTPRPVYERLARAGDLPWPRTSVYFADERAVAPDHPASNYRLVREALLDHVPVAHDRVYRMPADREDLDAAAREYESVLPPRFDILILGMGADGHTASLFPSAPALSEIHRRVLPAVGPEEPRRRLTVTPPAILAARLIVMLVSGSAKAEAVGRALSRSGPVAECPARLARRGVWILDRAAAGTYPRG